MCIGRGQGTYTPAPGSSHRMADRIASNKAAGARPLGGMFISVLERMWGKNFAGNDVRGGRIGPSPSYGGSQTGVTGG